MFVCACMCMTVEAKGQLQVSSSITLHFIFRDGISHEAGAH